MAEQLAPRRTPCATCPYRQGVPSGIWHPEEYDKLPLYDCDTAEQPPNVFMCHQAEGDICNGWFNYDDPAEKLAVRLAVISGRLDPSHVENWSESAAEGLFRSGDEAAAHGQQQILNPDDRARAAIEKIVRKRGL